MRSRRAADEDFDDESALQAKVVVIGEWESGARARCPLASAAHYSVVVGAPISGGRRGGLDLGITIMAAHNVESGPGGNRVRELLHRLFHSRSREIEVMAIANGPRTLFQKWKESNRTFPMARRGAPW